jgi:hypothetical protein
VRIGYVVCRPLHVVDEEAMQQEHLRTLDREQRSRNASTQIRPHFPNGVTQVVDMMLTNGPPSATSNRPAYRSLNPRRPGSDDRACDRNAVSKYSQLLKSIGRFVIAGGGSVGLTFHTGLRAGRLRRSHE